MRKFCACLFFIVFIGSAQSQIPTKTRDTLTVVEQDSVKKSKFFKKIGNGFFPTKYFDIDLRYLLKYNQYEAIRTGLGGRTNDSLSDKYRMNGYVVYGFRDHTFKYSIGGGFRLSKKSETWVNLAYTDDLQETGSSTFLTDKRFFSFFEPRLLNINLFHHHITKSIALEHRITPYLLSETQFSRSNVNPTYAYTFFVDDHAFKEFRMSIAKISLQWNPFNTFETMYFNEFFSDRFATLQVKHALKPFYDSKFSKPQMVLISRMALGNMSNIDRHQGISFGTLSKGYSEAGVELNKIIFGFGLSFAYRYGAYHLPIFTDNVAAKFTFNLTL